MQKAALPPVQIKQLYPPMLHLLNTHPLGNHNPHSILIVGSMAYDHIETPFDISEHTLGGSAIYGGIAASFFSPVSIIGVIGDDFDEKDLQLLKNQGIDLSGVQRLENEKTFFWKGKYLNGFVGRETMMTELNAFAHFNPQLLPNHKTCPYVFLGNISPHLQHSVLNQMLSPQFIIADTMNFWIENEKKSLLDLLKRIHLLVINDEEALELTQTYNIIEAGKTLQTLGSPYVIIKKGEHGAVFFYENELFTVPAYPTRHLKDPTGAGDSFAGAFIGYIASHSHHNITTFKHALIHATATASLTVEDFSCHQLIQNGKLAIDERVVQLKKMMRIEP